MLRSVFKNANAAYLASSSSPPSSSSSSSSAPVVAVVESPLNLGIENSRRFRALPVYAALLSEGRAGIAAMLARMVRLARRIAAVIRESEHYALLPEEEAEAEAAGDGDGDGDRDGDINIVVLFRARDDALNEALADRIRATGQWYVSGTSWRGRTACRVAVASWRAGAGASGDEDDDAELVRRSLAAIAAEHFG